MTLTEQLARLHPLTLATIGELAGLAPRSIRHYRDRGDRPLSATLLRVLAAALPGLVADLRAQADEVERAAEAADDMARELEQS